MNEIKIHFKNHGTDDFSVSLNQFVIATGVTRRQAELMTTAMALTAQACGRIPNPSDTFEIK